MSLIQRLRAQEQALGRLLRDKANPDSPELIEVAADLAGLLCAMAGGQTFPPGHERTTIQQGLGTGALIRETLLRPKEED